MNGSRCGRSVVKAILGACLGGLGGVVAQDVIRVAYSKVTLYKAVERIHKEAHADFVFVNRPGGPIKTFELPAGGNEATISAAARQFGKESVVVASVNVLEDSLPETSDPHAKLKAMEEYLADNFSASPDNPNPFIEFQNALLSDAKATTKELGAGDWEFGALSPAQQQRTVDILRAGQYFDPAISLGSVLQQFWQAEYPQRYR